MGSIIWIRTAAWGGVLILMFALGFLLGSSGGEGISIKAHKQVVSELADARAELRHHQTEKTEIGVDNRASKGATQDKNDSKPEKTEDAQLLSSLPPSSRPAPPKKQPTQRTYVAKEGDTFWAVAATLYGDGKFYPLILKANGLNEDSYMVPGKRYTIPAR